MAARPDATRVMLASCHAGPGGHGLFPLVDSRTRRQRISAKLSVMSISQSAVAVTRGRSPSTVPSSASTALRLADTAVPARDRCEA